MNDLDLLRRFEPVVRYTQGEMFFPCSVDAYLQQCSLWLRQSEGKAALLAPAGDLSGETLDKIGKPPPGSELYLRFTNEPLTGLEYQRWLVSSDHPPFQSIGRLARVGFVGRLSEALFDFSLLIRGRVPGGTTAKAQQQYKQMLAEDPRYVYYGRVLRDADYTVLQYMFFYAMNDWRSSFYGVNDHESDWEQVFVFLTEEDGDYAPQWVAFAAHDFKGDDLRRRWDDPELTKYGDDHVVVYAGAGSHAAYVLPGEYLMNVEPEVLAAVRRFLKPAASFLASVVSNEEQREAQTGETSFLSLAFVDYARGDGVAIGPGQERQWSPELLADALPWVSGYRGLWGLDTRDPFGGERAPAGPKFNRDGSVRQSWFDPLGWAGLDKVPTPANTIPEVEAAIDTLSIHAAEISDEIDAHRAELRRQALVLAAMAAAPNLHRLAESEAEVVTASDESLAELEARRAAVQEKRRLLQDNLARLRAGDRGDPQAHLRHKSIPQPPPPRIARLMDLWAAVSGALLVVVVVLLIFIHPPRWLFWTAVAIMVFGIIEAGMRGRLASYLVTVTILLALVASATLMIAYWRILIPAGLLGIFLFSIINNLRELGGRGGHS